MDVWYGTSLYNGHVQLSSFNAESHKEAVTKALEFYREIYSPVNFWGAEIKEHNDNNVVTIFVMRPLFIATLIKA